MVEMEENRRGYPRPLGHVHRDSARTRIRRPTAAARCSLTDIILVRAAPARRLVLPPRHCPHV